MGPVLLCCLCGEQLLRELGSEDLTEWKEMAEKCIPELDGASEHKDFKPKEELKTEIGINPILDVKPIEKSEIPTGVFSQIPESGNIRTILQTQNLVPFEDSIGSNKHQEPAVNEDEDLPVAVPWLMDEDETSNMSNQDGNLRTILQTQNLEPFKDSVGSNERQEPVVNEDEDLPVAVPWFLMDEDETFNMSNQE
ncbi:hypothetical protein NQ317_008242 [Molorchus minor]|uniref:Uncharacterized protein n=1 Tax=Molorchus minor TaxID=1323400 RepID=A0ABQ9J108_9CUCU|nr:hypothetical protein NQ317_008242 [Molorchus minor]